MLNSSFNKQAGANSHRVRELAQAMIEIARTNGAVTDRDLINRGFSQSELNALGADAGSIAGSRLSGEF
ncbi:hypothetical protein [Thalassospira sp. TSL5-1]|uniref:hypothetical protein n=1 Tax=Thalassospira sp. TSL5-1 TaxID=1544451 RepID=UPI00093F585F|nr:hypothetical protein [Thalassospira sp. TSL5-1]OKH89228.1 hypothetical protein LF95_04160 [Thalassospira sp. TSL5-1]